MVTQPSKLFCSSNHSLEFLFIKTAIPNQETSDGKKFVKWNYTTTKKGLKTATHMIAAKNKSMIIKIKQELGEQLNLEHCTKSCTI